MQENKIIEVIQVSKVFRDFWGRNKIKAINNLSFEVKQGEIFGLLGPNGSGKTTTIKLLLGLLFPTSGKIAIMGRSPRNVKNKRQIGFLPEESYLYPYQNAYEALFFYGRLFNLPTKICHGRVHSLLEMVGLSRAQNRPLKQYSKGMARRIGIAQALINDPDLVILDEPTSGLDPIGTREIKDLILQLKQKGKTILLCSHLLADVEDVCDRISILYGGKLCCQGQVNELLSNENITELKSATLPQETLAKVRELLDKEGVKILSVGNPTQKLENFFLDVIEKARSQQPETSGVEAGKQLANFFSEAQIPVKKESGVIDKLLKKTSNKEPEQDLPPPSSNEVIEKLTKPKSVEIEQKKPEVPKPKQGVLTKLLKPKHKKANLEEDPKKGETPNG